MPRPSPRLRILAVVAALGVLAGCGIDEDVVAREAAEAGPGLAETTTTAPPEAAGPSSPFTVGRVPEGYELRVTGEGEAEPGDDDVPVTVLAPDGEPRGPGVVFVEAVGADVETGFVPASDDEAWASLTVPGRRVWGLDAPVGDLRAVADEAELPSEVGGAPVVEDPPDGLEVVGSIGLDGVLGRAAVVPDDEDGPVPGPASAHATVWTADGSTLVAMTLPGDALDPAAIVTESRDPRRRVDEPRDAVAEDVTVGAATGVVTTTADPATGAVVRRELALETTWGDILLIVSRGQDILAPEDLVALAHSTTPD
ncbi:MAG TPA: hypothetical protein VGO60_11400 [Iamia sp.]|jgi:hypothetical protein|nr:hypothetical protein [Iamia sp.]